jgi:simple sugar transport system permease protein
MLLPTLTGGLNLAITFTANLAGVIVAMIVISAGGADASIGTFLLGSVAGLLAGSLCGLVIGAVIVLTGVHAILVSLAMMIFLRGLGEFITKGGDVSNFPAFVSQIGHGYVGPIPVPLLIFGACVLCTHLLLSRTKLGFTTYLTGSNAEATRYSGVNTKAVILAVYALSGLLCAIAGILMLARFSSVRVGHGESYILITILACFLGNVDPHGGFGRVIPVTLALIILQVLSSGANILGASQHLATAIWGFLLIAVLTARWATDKVREYRHLRRWRAGKSLTLSAQPAPPQSRPAAPPALASKPIIH